MQDKVILDLCGGTGSWSKPYKDAGYDVRVITLPEYDVTLVYCDHAGICLPVSDGSMQVLSYAHVHGILAAPPCTEFSLAKTTAPRNLDRGMDIVSACLNIVWRYMASGKLKWWALENPVGLLRKFMGRPQFTFYQWEYEGEFVKRTDLWGFFNAPSKTVRERPPNLTKQFPYGSYNSLRWNHPACPEEYVGMGLTMADIRAITPPGFAQAFFKANP